MTYTNLTLGFLIQFTVVPFCAAIIFVLTIMVSSKYFTSNFAIDILMNVGIFTFPLSWIISFIMIYNTYMPRNDTYNMFWHVFPFVVVFVASILVSIYIKYIRKHS